MFRTPHISIRNENPVFDYDLRRVKGRNSPGRLWAYSALLQTFPVVLISIAYFARLRSFALQYGTASADTYYHHSFFYSGWSTLIAITLVVSVLTAFVGGLHYMSVSIHSINTQMNTGHWDMLRLSPLDDDTVLRAKEAIAHIRAWRLMHIEIALRMAQITYGVLGLCFHPLDAVSGQWLAGENSIIGYMAREFGERPLSVLVRITLLVAIGYVWIMEPRWRMRTITTIGLALSARVHNLSMASVAAFFGMVGFYIAHIALLVGTVWVLTVIGSLYYSAAFAAAANIYPNDINLPYQAFSYSAFAGMIYFSYWGARRLAWRSALQQAFKADR